MRHQFLGPILIVGLLSILAACGRDDAAPTSPPPKATPVLAVAAVPATETVPQNLGYPPAVRRVVSANMLDKFLQVRERMFNIYKKKGTSHVLSQWIIDGETIDPRAAGDAELHAVLYEFNRERHLGLAEAGLHEKDYRRIEETVYRRWWKATAGQKDVVKAVAFQEELLGLIEAELDKPTIDDTRRRNFEVRREMSEYRIAILEWSRSTEAARTLGQIVPETRQVCEGRAEEIHHYAMLPLQPYADLFSILGVRPIQTLQATLPDSR